MTDKHIQNYDPFAPTQSKICEARQLVSSSLTADAVRLIERDTRNELSGDGGLREALAPIHRKAFEIVAGVGLEIRHRGLTYSAMPDQGLGTGIRIDVPHRARFAKPANWSARRSPPTLCGSSSATPETSFRGTAG